MFPVGERLPLDEAYEEFIRRARRYFPEESVKSWSKVDRLIFNHLMGKLIHRHGYAAISDDMLRQCSEDMAQAVSRFAGG